MSQLMAGEFLIYSSPEWLEKANRTSSHLLAVHNEEWPIIPQPQCGRCHRAGTGQTMGGYWQQAELCTEMMLAEQWWWWWWLQWCIWCVVWSRTIILLQIYYWVC